MYKHIPLKIGAILLVAILVIPLAYSSIARADNGSQDRELSVNASNNGYFSVDSKSLTPGGGHGNEFELVFAGNTLLMTFRNSTHQQNSSLEFAITLDRLVYSSSSGSNNTLIDFGDSGFSLMGSTLYSTMMGTPGISNSTYREFGVYAKGDNTIFAMIVQVNGVPANVSTPGMPNTQLNLTPNEVKLSFLILNTSGPMYMPSTIPNQTNPSGNFSLQLTVSSPSGVPVPMSTSQGFALNFNESNNSGYFAWSSNAYVRNGISQAWSSTRVGYSFNGLDLTLTYPAAQEVLHDPIMGISPQTLSSAVYSVVKAAGNIIIYSIALTLAIVLVAASALYRRKN